MTAPSNPPPDPGATERDSRYPNYVLTVLVIVYIFNFIDRQIISILNERIKADLLLTDAQMGFLYGTAFAIFYALFGIPLGRLADVWTRRSLISIGLAFWSAMTTASGFAHNFVQLAAARIGVGVGEASATPAAFSLLSDYFPPARRATVLAIYSSGVYLGAGLSLFLGGQIVERWDAAFTPGTAPLGLWGWQAAYLMVGLPGLLLALWVRSLREPVRGQSEGLFSKPEPHPFREFGKELLAVLPPLTVLHLQRAGGGSRLLLGNALGALAIATGAAGLGIVTGDWAQWIALGIGVYAAFSWAQGLGLRDRSSSALILGTPSLRWICVGLSFLAFTAYGIGYWTPPFFQRMHGVSVGESGLILGGASAAGGFLGVTLGGIAADYFRQRSPTGRLWIALATAIFPIPLVVWMLTTEHTATAYIVNFPASVLSTMWLGVGASTVQDLVLPRMRASASAFYLLLLTFIGLALGPYTIGKLADVTGSLRTAMLMGLLANAAALFFIGLGMRTLARDEASLRERARAAGEPDV